MVDGRIGPVIDVFPVLFSDPGRDWVSRALPPRRGADVHVFVLFEVVGEVLWYMLAWGKGSACSVAFVESVAGADTKINVKPLASANADLYAGGGLATLNAE